MSIFQPCTDPVKLAEAEKNLLSRNINHEMWDEIARAIADDVDEMILAAIRNDDNLRQFGRVIGVDP